MHLISSHVVLRTDSLKDVFGYILSTDSLINM
uniref:Uncharacterized protein n=1 Tax=Anguilla anguilla TaxID=7936 RepID=A0A0E9UYG5_ANGAN